MSLPIYGDGSFGGNLEQKLSVNSQQSAKPEYLYRAGPDVWTRVSPSNARSASRGFNRNVLKKRGVESAIDTNQTSLVRIIGEISEQMPIQVRLDASTLALKRKVLPGCSRRLQFALGNNRMSRGDLPPAAFVQP